MSLPAHMKSQSALHKLQKVRKAMLVCIALAGLGATGWFGASAWRSGQAGIEQSSVLNQGQQIAGAAHLHGLTQGGVKTATLEHLREEGYLRDIPLEWQDGHDYTYAMLPALDPSACQRLNERAGLVGEKRIVLTVEDPESEQTATFGCLPVSRTAFFKY